MAITKSAENHTNSSWLTNTSILATILATTQSTFTKHIPEPTNLLNEAVKTSNPPEKEPVLVWDTTNSDIFSKKK
jgi:hypothetical protein